MEGHPPATVNMQPRINDKGWSSIIGVNNLSMEYVYEIRNMECMRYVYGGLPKDSLEGTIKCNLY
jgi:hypothetical protein